MPIGKADQKNVVSGSAVLRQESAQAKNIDAGQIIKLILRVRSCFNYSLEKWKLKPILEYFEATSL